MLLIFKPFPAHHQTPHAGYGMNFGVGDAVDLGFKLAAVVKGYDGPLLLWSYSLEGRLNMM
jgi:2-polyprenyl-6-methoxyphenol hydroxylase-like FAD-dependent oxidoreductase